MHTDSTLPLNHWGLERWPYPAAPQASQLYPTEGQTEALARIDHLVEAGRRVGVVVGEPGVGKTLLLQTAARKLARAGRAVALVDVVGMASRELLWQFAAGLGAAPQFDADVPRLWRLVADRVTENRLLQIPTVLLVDGSGEAGPDLLAQLVRLARLDRAPTALWTIVLAAEPAQPQRWSESLRELIDLRIELAPWSEADTIGYVQTALVDAGCFEPVFDHDALAELHELAGGIPRKVARLANFALLAGAAAGATSIDATQIRAAHEETNWAMAATLV